jgi:hypothetical protein
MRWGKKQMIVGDIGDTEDFEKIDPEIQLLKKKRADGSGLNIWAYLDSGGRLHIDGQDLGPVTKSVSSDGECEYFYTIPAEDIPALVKVLGGKAGGNVLDVLKQKWSGRKSYKLGELLEKSQIRLKLSIWNG